MFVSRPPRVLLAPGLIVLSMLLLWAGLRARPGGSSLSGLRASPQDDEARLDAEIAAIRQRARPLMPADERLARGHLSWSAATAGLSLQRLELSPGTDPGQVRARLELRGPAFHLPVLLEGIESQAALAAVEALLLDATRGGEAEIHLVLAYRRPRLPDEPDASARAAQLARRPGAPPASLLLQAARLSAWRAFERDQARRRTLAHARAERLQAELPALLVRAWKEGGRILYGPVSGLRWVPRP